MRIIVNSNWKITFPHSPIQRGAVSHKMKNTLFYLNRHHFKINRPDIVQTLMSIFCNITALDDNATLSPTNLTCVWPNVRLNYEARR